MVAERRKLRWATATLFPGNIPSVHGAAGQSDCRRCLDRPTRGELPFFAWWFSRLVLRALFDRPLNAVRLRARTGAGRDVFLLSGLSPELHARHSSPHHAPRQPDQPASIEVTGFALWDEPRAAPMPPQARRIPRERHAAGRVHLGASLAIDQRSTSSRSRPEALAEVGARGVFLVGREANVAGHAARTSPSCRSRRCPRCSRASAIVHHGGIGTTATALRSRVPALVIPRLRSAAPRRAHHRARRRTHAALEEARRAPPSRARSRSSRGRAVVPAPAPRHSARRWSRREDGIGTKPSRLKGFRSARAPGNQSVSSRPRIAAIPARARPPAPARHCAASLASTLCTPAVLSILAASDPAQAPACVASTISRTRASP